LKRICEYCGQELELPSQLTRMNKRFCNRKCKDKQLNLCKCGRKKLVRSTHCIICHKERNVPNWKGGSAGYTALHEWLHKRKPKPKFCEECGLKPPHDLANISGEYKRDLNDYRWLCHKCHMRIDAARNRNSAKQYAYRRHQLFQKGIGNRLIPTNDI